MKTFTIEYDETKKVMKMTDPDGNILNGLKTINLNIWRQFDNGFPYRMGYNCEGDCEGDCDGSCDTGLPGFGGKGKQQPPEEKLTVSTNYNQTY